MSIANANTNLESEMIRVPEGRSERPDVLFALVGDVRKSSRALRQLRALREMGANVRVVMLGDQPSGGFLADGLPVSPALQIETLAISSGSGPGFFWTVHKQVREAALRTEAAVYMASDLYTLPALTIAATRNDGRLVFDSRELYAHLDSSEGKPWVRSFWKFVERLHIRKADSVFTVNRSIADRLATAYGIATPTVLHNIPEFVEIKSSDRLRERLGIPSDRKIVLYQGGLRRGRGLPQLIRAVAEIEIAHLVIIGEGPLEQESRRLAAAAGDRVSFLPFTPPDELLAWTASADLGSVLIEPRTESLRLALPNKLFEYLMAGIPVLASPIPEIRAVFDKFNVGLLVDPNDQLGLVTALRTALTDETERSEWRANATRALSTYSWDRDKLIFQKAIYDLLTS